MLQSTRSGHPHPTHHDIRSRPWERVGRIGGENGGTRQMSGGSYGRRSAGYCRVPLALSGSGKRGEDAESR